MLLVNGAGVCINEIIWQIIWWHYRDARKMWLLYYFVSLHWLAGICSSVFVLYLPLYAVYDWDFHDYVPYFQHIHRFWGHDSVFDILEPNSHLVLVWAKSQDSVSLWIRLCLCLAWFTHSLLRSPQKRKKKNPRESPGSNENRCYQKGSIVETVFNHRPTSLF